MTDWGDSHTRAPRYGTMYHQTPDWRVMSSRRARLRRNPKTSGSDDRTPRIRGRGRRRAYRDALGAAAAFGIVQKWLQDLPDYKAKNAFEVAQATKIYSADGKLLARLYLENREVVPLSQISPYLVNGVVAVEDERFYSHNGVDPIGLVRAAVRTASGNRQGASTITQQYIRNTILLDERTDMTYAAQGARGVPGLELEKRHTKPEILEMYLNTDLPRRGCLRRAGRLAASTSTVPRASSRCRRPPLLAGLAQSPSRLDPYHNPEGAIARRNEVLGRMLANNYITQAEYDAAVATKLKLRPQQGTRTTASTRRRTSWRTSRSCCSSSSRVRRCSRAG